MDGKNGTDGIQRIVATIKHDNLAWPNALTIDFFSAKLWWADAHLDYVAYCDFDGQNKHTVLRSKDAPHVFALNILDDWLYWSDWNKKAIQDEKKRNIFLLNLRFLGLFEQLLARYEEIIKKD